MTPWLNHWKEKSPVQQEVQQKEESQEKITAETIKPTESGKNK
jgi:hypothetical protein